MSVSYYSQTATLFHQQGFVVRAGEQESFNHIARCWILINDDFICPTQLVHDACLLASVSNRYSAYHRSCQQLSGLVVEPGYLCSCFVPEIEFEMFAVLGLMEPASLLVNPC